MPPSSASVTLAGRGSRLVRPGTTITHFVSKSPTRSHYMNTIMVHITAACTKSCVPVSTTTTNRKTVVTDGAWYDAASTASAASNLSWIGLMGDAIGAYVLIYCTLQWWYYRDIRKKAEESEKKKKDAGQDKK